MEQQTGIREALQYAVALSKGQDILHTVNEKVFFDKSKAELCELDGTKYPEPIAVKTLDGLVDFLKIGFDSSIKQKFIIHIAEPEKVLVFSELDADAKRIELINAKPEVRKFEFGRFMSSEMFIINLLSIFERTEDAEALIKCASSIRIEGGGDISDNGVSQTVTVKQGASTLSKAKVPSPVSLRPYRTFLEVDQPESNFVFRINDSGECALFEADGGIWRHEAIDKINDYLSDLLEEEIKGKFYIIK